MKTFPQNSPCRATYHFSRFHFLPYHDLYLFLRSNDKAMLMKLRQDNTATFTPHRKIVVWRDGVLNIDGATLNNARIVVKPGGRVNITNGAVINLRDAKSFVVPKGAQLTISKGVIK